MILSVTSARLRQLGREQEERKAMFNHGPSCLNGPVSRERGWWTLKEVEILFRMERHPSTMDDTAREAGDDDRPIRTELVERIRREIAEGTYETTEKLEAAFARMLERLQE